MRHSLLLVTLIVVTYSMGCVSRGQDERPSSLRPEERRVTLRPVPAHVNVETEPSFQAVETKIKGKSGTLFEFKRAQFVNENHGWAMSSGSLYRTKDGGKSWERLPHRPENEAAFEAFFFVDESRGWLTAVKRAYRERYGLGNSSVIMVTNDGGESWRLQASFPKEVVISEIRFFNKDEGLAAGAQIIDSRPPYQELLLIKTSNGGEEWSNISEPAKSAIKNESAIASDSGQDIEWTLSSVLLLTRYGRVISTKDGGETWRLLASFKDERPNGVISSTGYRKLALDAGGRVRVVAGGEGDEGYWGDFVVEENGQWTSYETKLTPMRDALFLSNNEVLACGASLRPNDEASKHLPDDAGVILRSFDSGKSWQTIYRSKSYETFFYLTKVNDNEFYAVSDTGTFLRFSLPQ